jgi:hypothetical protein
MFEVPAGFLNVLFTLLIVYASVNRSAQRSLERAFAPN